ncbi:putative nucleotidyltransferase, ribonuclease H [Tanacetum coccineum]
MSDRLSVGLRWETLLLNGQKLSYDHREYDQVETVAYRLELPEQTKSVSKHLLRLDIRSAYPMKPVEIMDRDSQAFEASRIPIDEGVLEFFKSGPSNIGRACSFMLCDLDFEPLSLSLSSLPSCDLMSLTNMLILLHYLESFKSEFAELNLVEKVTVAKEKLKEARSRQKNYADKHRRDLEFQAGDRVFLKVSPFREVKRFGIKGKLSPRFIGPIEILERIGEVSYRLTLPPQLSHVHDVFHVSLLRGYHYHPLHVASYPFDQIQPDMSLSEEPESILDRQERVMRNKVIPFVKILWKNHPEREATWETEESMRASYPHFFV